MKVDRDPADSVIARIVAMVEEASRTKAPTQLFVEKVEQRYSLGMVAATIALFAAPLLFGAALQPTLLRAMTFMIVASPCAVVLATMPPLLSAIANAGRHGVLVKSAVVMERVGQVDAVAFDKTGTLTEGTPRVTDVRPLAGSGLDAAALLRLAAAAEHASEHPLARAVADAARGLDVPPPPTSPPPRASASPPPSRAGPSRSPTPPACRTRQRAGPPPRSSPGWRTRAVPRSWCWSTAPPPGCWASPTGCGRRPAGTVAALTALTGTSPFLATGDNPRAAARLAAEAGIADVRAGLLPQDKAAAVRELAETGRKVLVVGDGVNDAPALAAAHTGIAMGRASSDLALETADAVVVRDELGTVPTLVSLSRAARRLVVQNLVIIGVFITGLVVWDLAGRLPLPLGVAGHEGSTVIVGLNGLRLLADSAWRRARPAYPSAGPAR